MEALVQTYAGRSLEAAGHSPEEADLRIHSSWYHALALFEVAVAAAVVDRIRRCTRAGVVSCREASLCRS